MQNIHRKSLHAQNADATQTVAGGWVLILPVSAHLKFWVLCVCCRSYHMECLTPPIDAVPVEEWFCPECEANNRTSSKPSEDVNQSAIRDLSFLKKQSD